MEAVSLKGAQVGLGVRTPLLPADEWALQVHPEDPCPMGTTTLHGDLRKDLVIDLWWRGDQGGAEGGDAVRQDPPGHQGDP